MEMKLIEAPWMRFFTIEKIPTKRQHKSIKNIKNGAGITLEWIKNGNGKGYECLWMLL